MVSRNCWFGLFFVLALSLVFSYSIPVFADGSFSAESNTSARMSSTAHPDVNDWSGTGKSNSGATVSNPIATVCSGESISITFSHNIYSRDSQQNVPYTVTRSGFGGSGYSVDVNTDAEGHTVSDHNSAMSVDGVSNGYVNISTSAEGGYLTADNRPYYDTSGTDNSYVHRDYYNISFNDSGIGNYYEFCETMSVGGSGVLSQACSSVYVDDCYGTNGGDMGCGGIASEGVTTVSSHVQRSGSGWRKSVYVRPDNTVDWQHCYYSGVQSRAKELVSSDAHHTHGIGDSSDRLYSQKSAPISQVKTPWQNFFKIDSDVGNSKTSPDFGVGSVVTERTLNSYNVSQNDVGRTLTESITSGTPSSVTIAAPECGPWNCDPYESCDENGENCETRYNQCYHGYNDNDCWIASSVSGPVSDQASALVPYNFTITASVSLKQKIVDAGEIATVEGYKVSVNERYNAVVGDTYKTKTGGIRKKLVGYVSATSSGSAKETADSNFCYSLPVYGGKCAIYSDEEKGADGIDDNVGMNGNYNVFDAPAGRYFCVVAAVYPASSGSDTSMSPSGSGTWYISAPSCAKIAKKPSLQVWGAGMYTADNIALVDAVKHVINGKLNDISPKARDIVRFGSWVEQNIVANGKIINLASGAADGLAGATGRSIVVKNDKKIVVDGSYFGSVTNDANCILSPLTMPNSKCRALNGPGGGDGAGSMDAPKDKEVLIARFVNSDKEDFAVHDECSIGGLPSFSDKMTHVFRCNGDFTISGNVAYYGNYFSSTIDIPKIIIYAKNITISCGVREVDAVLIADGVVNTCPEVTIGNSKTYEKAVASTQLKINGAVITDKMLAGRTYGAATGMDSDVPAEIINYDTTLYLWGSPRADVVGSGKLETVYQTELSPRY